MLSVYIVAAIVGTGLALVGAMSAFSGHDAEHSHDTDHGADQGDTLGHDGHHGGPSEHGLDALGFFSAFLSLRFWTYALAGFGALGTVLTLTQAAAAPVILGASLGVGVVCGLGVYGLMCLAKRAEFSSAAGSSDLLYKEAEVIVTIRPGQLGKVRMSVKGDLIDMAAFALGDATFEVGRKVYVTDLDGDKVLVQSISEITGEQTNIVALG